MQATSQEATRVANKVALAIRFVESSAFADNTELVVEESIRETRMLLEQLDASQFRIWYEQFLLSFERQREEFSDYLRHQRFVATSCDLMHASHYHQKLIAELGDQLSVWRPASVDFQYVADALDKLILVSAEPVVNLSARFKRELELDSAHATSSNSFVMVVYGLTIITTAIKAALDRNELRNLDWAGLAMFGGHLIHSNIAQLSVESSV